MPITFSRHLLAAAALLASLGTQAAEFSFSGDIVHHKDLVVIDFSLSAPAEVTLWTDSWQSGVNFDPMLSLYTAGGSLVTSFDDPVGNTWPVGVGYYDASQRFTPLAAGHYRLVLGASYEPGSAGYQADAPIPLAQWNQWSYDPNANDQKGGFWRLNLSGVEQAAVVPEPGRIGLMLAGLLSIALVVRQRQRKQ
jgi:hypothetical protein